ncbi:hypothetical protein NYA30BAC_01396 [Halomonas sp. NYA30]
MHESLHHAYSTLLSDHDLYPLQTRADMYSGVFLPRLIESYQQAPFKLMLVGQETKGWNGKLQRLIEARKANAIEAYVSASTETYQKRRMKKPGQSQFLQFLHHAERALELPKNSIHWANLHAVDYRGGSPRHRPQAEVCAFTPLSQALLALQIDQLKPDAILFTTGPSGDRFIKALCNDHLGGYHDSNVVVPRKLWRFTAAGIPCFRTTHPRRVSDIKYRNEALSLIQATR